MTLTSLALTILVSLISGGVGGIVGWFATTLIGKPLARFFNLRSDAHTAIYDCANISADRVDVERAVKAQTELRRIAAQIDAISAILPRSMIWLLSALGFDFGRAVRGMTGLSNSLVTHDGTKTRHRVLAQQGLCLPIDPSDAEYAARFDRLDGRPI